VPRARVISSPPNNRHQRLIATCSSLIPTESGMGRTEMPPGVGVAVINPFHIMIFEIRFWGLRFVWEYALACKS
jgi:hypothetical protein